MMWSVNRRDSLCGRHPGCVHSVFGTERVVDSRVQVRGEEEEEEFAVEERQDTKRARDRLHWRSGSGPGPDGCGRRERMEERRGTLIWAFWKDF